MFTKFAKAEILESRSSERKLDTPALSRFSSYNDYRTSDGYIYTRVRAISSRVNKNFDGWPSEELAAAYRSFIGKPIFVDHHNSNPEKARGVIVDAILHVENDMGKASALDPYYATAPANHKPPTWIELLLETDAKSYPKLAADIISGNIDSVSMGANVSHTKCSICNHDAYDTDDFCDHVKLKGASFDAWDENGKKTSKVAYEDCYKVSFFEISYVFDPADETALVHEVKTSKTASEDDDDDESGNGVIDPFGDWEKGLDREYDTDLQGYLDRNDIQVPQRKIHEMQDWELEIMARQGDEAAAAQLEQRGKDRDLGRMQREVDGPSQNEWAARDKWEQGGGVPADLQGDIVDNIFNAGPAPHEPSAAERTKDDNEAAFQEYLQRTAPQSEFKNPDGSPVDTRSDLDQFPHPDDPRMARLIEAARKILAENPLPQSMETTVPERVDTLREEKICPICGQEYADGHCDTCGYEEPPASFDNPDLGLAEKVRDLLEQSQENLAEPGAEMPAAPGGMPPMPPGMDGPPPGGPEGPPPPGGPQMMAATNNPVATSSVNNDWTIVIRSRTASKVNKNEVPILPPARYTSDLPTGQSVVKSSPKPVESKTKDKNKMSHWDVIANELKKRGNDPVKVAALIEAGVIDRLLDRLSYGNGEGTKADFPEQNLDQVGGVTGNPEAGTTHENVDKDTSPGVAPNTMTFGDNGTDAVTSEVGSAGVGPIGTPVSKVKNAAGFPDHEPTHVDLLKPIAEPVGPDTQTFKSDAFHVGDPITQENANQVGGPIGTALASAKAHIFKAIRLAETEVSLGMIPAEEKFDRAAVLEQHTPEDLTARSETLASVKKAGLGKTTAVKKTVSKVPAGLSKSAAVSVESHSSSDDGDAALFM
jgi:hypothetical protein